MYTFNRVPSLESITYTYNAHVPWFTPFNYYLYYYRRIYDFNLVGSIIISQILPVFKDYNIPLVSNDFLYYVNPGDNVANGLDIDNFAEIQTDDPYLLRQKQYWEELYDAFDSFEKVAFLRSDFEQMIQKEIIEQYSYPFDRSDPQAYEKFRRFLNENVTYSGIEGVPVFTKQGKTRVKDRFDKYIPPRLVEK